MEWNGDLILLLLSSSLICGAFVPKQREGLFVAAHVDLNYYRAVNGRVNRKLLEMADGILLPSLSLFTPSYVRLLHSIQTVDAH